MPFRLVDQVTSAAAAETKRNLAAQKKPPNDPTPVATYREQLSQAKSELTSHRGALLNQYRQIQAVKTELTQARAQGSQQVEELETNLARLMAGLKQHYAQQAALTERVVTAQRQLVERLGTASAYGELESLPLVMLPVRLETRYFAADADHYELRVRIYPDEIHIDNHQDLLSAAEADMGQQYWQARLIHGEESEETLAAWGYLCQQMGEDRAFQIVAVLDPAGFGRQQAEESPAARELHPVPEVMIAPEEWADTPKAVALPDRWAIVGYRGDRRVLLHWTNPVPPELPVSPDLAAPLADEDIVEPDDGIRWMTDFETAEAMGMAARIRVNKTIARSMDRLLVFGIDASQPPKDGTFELSQLIKAHTHTGLQFVPPGTPTNNTSQAKTEYRRPVTHRESHQRLLASHTPAPEQSNAMRLAAALGIRGDVFRFLKHRLADTETPLEAMYEALWPATWREFLQHQIELPVTHGVVNFFDQFIRDCVRPRGFLPTLRVGAQPYGILPIVSLARWQSHRSSNSVIEKRLANGLRSLHQYWMKEARIPHLAGNEDAPLLYGDPQRTLLRILSMAPTTQVTRGIVQHYASDQAAETARTKMRRWWTGLLNKLSQTTVDFDERIENATLRDRKVALRETVFLNDNPLVSPQEDKTVPIVDSENYIAALSKGLPPSMVGNHQLPGAQTQSWLYVMMRSAYLLAPSSGDFVRVIESLKVLKDLPVETLETLATDIIDGASHRLDAWVSALAHRRLTEVRSRKDQIHLGGYGWIEGLEPPGEGAIANGPVVEDADSAGYLHMPSLAQAKTAAILYGANQAQAEQTERNSLYAINLSSEKVRRAKGLLEGINQGQSLGALLGYWLERRMIERELAQFILPLREFAPLPVGDLPTDSLSTNHGVDGLQIYARWQDGTLRQHLGSRDFNRLTPVLNELHFAQDGLSDLLLAEGIHQATNGNAVLAAAAFDAMADGSSRVGSVEVTATPVASQQLTHRVGVLLPAASGADWPGDDQRIRAIAEPRLNAWAAAMLGAPDDIHFTATLVGADETVEVQNLTLAEFDLCPLDVVYLAGPRQEARRDGADITPPLVDLLRFFLQLRHGVKTVTIGLRDGAQTSLADALAIAQNLFDVLGNSRPLQPADLTAAASDGAQPPAVQTAQSADLAGRADATQQQVVRIQTDLENTPLQPEHWWQAALLIGPSDPTLADSLSGMIASFAQRLTAAAEQSEPMGQIQALLGKDFRAMAPFTPDNPGDLATNFAHQADLLEADSTLPKRWLQDYARVRPRVESLDLALTLGELFRAPSRLQVAQLPYQPGQVWVGERKPAQGLPPLSLVMHTPFDLSALTAPLTAPLTTPLTAQSSIAGLVIDTWSEALPKDTTVTGLAFNYDEPKAQAPQAILMALPPDISRNWQFEDLESALLETFDLMKLRANTVPPFDITNYLPSLMPSGDLSNFFKDF